MNISVKHIIASLMIIIPFICWVTILMRGLIRAIGVKEFIKFVFGFAILVVWILLVRWMLFP